MVVTTCVLVQCNRYGRVRSEKKMPSLQEFHSQKPPHLPFRHPFFQFLRFSLVGILNTLIDVVLFNLFVWIFSPNNSYMVIILNAVAYSIGALNSFFLNKWWTFKQHDRATPNQVVSFILVTGLGIVGNSAFLWLATLILTLLSFSGFFWVNIAKVSAIAGSVMISYLGMRLRVFNRYVTRAGHVNQISVDASLEKVEDVQIFR